MPDNFFNRFESETEALEFYRENVSTARVTHNGRPITPNWVTCETDVCGNDHWHLRYFGSRDVYESTISEWGRSLVHVVRPAHAPITNRKDLP
jgi:hypothetical protein